MVEPISRAAAKLLSWEELEAAGLDDCGQPLEGHPPLPPVRPWRSSWTSRDGAHAEAHREAGRRHGAALVQPLVYARGHHRGRGFVIRRETVL